MSEGSLCHNCERKYGAMTMVKFYPSKKRRVGEGFDSHGSSERDIGIL